MKIVLLGPPGAGKGTQAAFIKEEFPVRHISTGDIFRTNMREKTPLGILAASYIDKGCLVPDEVTIELVKDTIKDLKSFMLDGFPRTIEQAKALDEIAPPDIAIDIDVNIGKLMKRITGRCVCTSCKATYHVNTLNGRTRCVCGHELVQRDDDKPETVRKRIDVYKEETAPLIEYYAERGKLITVNGDAAPEYVFSCIAGALRQLK